MELAQVRPLSVSVIPPPRCLCAFTARSTDTFLHLHVPPVLLLVAVSTCLMSPVLSTCLHATYIHTRPPIHVFWHSPSPYPLAPTCLRPFTCFPTQPCVSAPTHMFPHPTLHLCIHARVSTHNHASLYPYTCFHTYSRVSMPIHTSPCLSTHLRACPRISVPIHTSLCPSTRLRRFQHVSSIFLLQVS
jgi:hypothetical protein